MEGAFKETRFRAGLVWLHLLQLLVRLRGRTFVMSGWASDFIPNELRLENAHRIIISLSNNGRRREMLLS